MTKKFEFENSKFPKKYKNGRNLKFYKGFAFKTCFEQKTFFCAFFSSQKLVKWTQTTKRKCFYNIVGKRSIITMFI